MLKRLAGSYATREEELDQLLRDEVFVDLYKVVRESLRISEPGYGLKKVEGFYMAEREADLTDGEESIVIFERWLEDGGIDGGDQAILDAIADYNEDDCVSTYLLREWLLERRAEAEAAFGQPIEWFAGTPEEPGEVARGSRDRAADRGADRGPAGGPRRDGRRASAPRWLIAQLLDYHQPRGAAGLVDVLRAPRRRPDRPDRRRRLRRRARAEDADRPPRAGSSSPSSSTCASRRRRPRPGPGDQPGRHAPHPGPS